jgi:hypothetical protein
MRPPAPLSLAHRHRADMAAVVRVAVAVAAEEVVAADLADLAAVVAVHQERARPAQAANTR